MESVLRFQILHKMVCISFSADSQNVPPYVESEFSCKKCLLVIHRYAYVGIYSYLFLKYKQ